MSILFAVFVMASTAPAQPAPAPVQSDYLPTKTSDRPTGELRERVLDSSALFLLINPSLRDDKLRAQLGTAGLDTDTAEALIRMQSGLPHLAHSAEFHVGAFLGTFLGNVTKVRQLEQVSDPHGSQSKEARKEIVVTVDVGFRRHNGQTEVCLALQLVRLVIGPDAKVQDSELLFADRAMVPLRSVTVSTVLDAYQASLHAAIREIAPGLLAWRRMVEVDWRMSHDRTVGSGLNDAMPSPKETK